MKYFRQTHSKNQSITFVSTMKIRPATHDDLAQISAIYNHAVIHSTATFDTEEKSPEYQQNKINQVFGIL